MQLELGDNALWYVRAAIARGLQSIENDNEKVRKELANNPDIAPTFREMGEGMLRYNEQMLREMKQFIPDELAGGAR